ncbi:MULTISPECIES: glyoxalase superfamily protein [unclassified Sphingomonas]|uniref:glyoxalase superfamily protein n=1 Tax=unclassified Sphingomonas TaxID=196159 RepID=UPI00082DBDD8|nr:MULTISPECIES: glyoxalase superfamily protein [unclassified Sphingomonas]
MTVRFGRANPIFRVADMTRALDYYTNSLGFTHNWGDEIFAEVARGEAVVMLCQDDQGSGRAWLYVGVDDVDRLHTEIVARGARIRNGPCNYPWGARELHVEDPDGNVLRFGAGATDAPCGDWLAHDGTRWTLRSDGSWVRSD